MDYSKEERLNEFYRRLTLAPAMASFEEAYEQLCDVLNQVEDELTAIPFDPDRWEEDGRMYPPQMDNAIRRSGTGIIQFRSRYHRTRIGDNGAIEIQDIRTGVVIFRKPGRDGGFVS